MTGRDGSGGGGPGPRDRAGLLAAYRATRYVVLEGLVTVTARVGRPSPGLDALLARRGAAAGAFLTAWNPMSVPTPERLNLAAQRRLERELDAMGVPFLPHLGLADAGGWAEGGAFALGLGVERALALALRHGQYAIAAAAAPGGPLRLVPTRLMPAG